jgi:DNA-binding transcriptional ArsR family regulator
MLVELIDRLNEAIGAGANAATLRPQLSTLREQAEAIEARLKLLETRLQELEANAQNQNLAAKKGGFEDGANKILELLFERGRSTALEHMARGLGLAQSVAQYHADSLYAAGMIELIAVTPAGRLFMLSAKGRAYVMKHLLKK